MVIKSWCRWNANFYVWVAAPSERRIVRSSSHYGIMVMKMDVHSVCITSLKWTQDCLLSDWLYGTSIKRDFYIWAPMLSEKTMAKSSSYQRDESECPLSQYCKFELNLKLFVIWLVSVVAMKFMPIVGQWNCDHSSKQIFYRYQ